MPTQTPTFGFPMYHTDSPEQKLNHSNLLGNHTQEDGETGINTVQRKFINILTYSIYKHNFKHMLKSHLTCMRC